MTPFVTSLAQRMVALKADTEALRLSLRQQRIGCACSERGWDSRPANKWSGRLETEEARESAIRVLVEAEEVEA